MDSLTNKVVKKTRKVHQCFSCLRVFPVGSTLNYWSGVYDGDFNSGYSCLTCVDIMNRAEDDGEGFPRGFVADSLYEGQTPEILLEYIKKNNITL